MSAQEPAPAPGHAGHGAALAQYARDWAEACSICFENRCDFCLPACQDQFCKPCVKRYFTEKIRDSWGLTVTKLTCPVCYDPLSIDLVKKYIDEETLVLYRKYNDPHRGLSRHCAVCQCEQAVALPTRDCDWDRLARDFDRALEDTVGDERRVSAVREELDAVHRGKGDAAALFAALLSAASHVAVHPAGDTRSRSKRRREGDDEALADGHVVLMGRIALPADVDATFTSLSRAMIRTVLVPEARLALQFLHVKAFPRHSCDRCGARMCFQCGESSWHGDGATCEDDMRARIRAICERGAVAGDGVILARDRHELDTLQWKLQNGKRCPRCCIFIERDDGCNKMDCLYCGNQVSACGRRDAHVTLLTNAVSPVLLELSKAVEQGVRVLFVSGGHPEGRRRGCQRGDRAAPKVLGGGRRGARC
eukprot:Opistho-1_new@17725